MRGLKQFRLIFIALAVLVGLWVRVQGFDATLDMLHHDEAWNGWRAARWLEQPQFAVFFPDNTGVEAGFTYWLAPFVALFGATPLALRVAMFCLHALTLAAAYPAGNALFGGQRGGWLVLALGALYWHAHFAHVAYRANLFILVALLALTALLHAWRTGDRRRWIIAGLFAGLLAWTYTAAHGWAIVLIGAFLLTALLQAKHRHGALFAAGTALVLAVPVWGHIATASGDGGLSRTAVDSVAAIVENLKLWLNVWTARGDSYYMHNLPDRPALDVPLALLTVTGIVGAWFVIRRRRYMPLIVTLGLAGIVPALVTIQQPHFLRGIGAVIPLACLIAAGAVTLNKFVPRRAGTVLAIVLIGWGTINSAQVFPQWLADGHRLAQYIDDRVSGGLGIIIDETPPDMPVYIPGLAFHPVAAYLDYSMPQREVHFYNFPDGDCFVTPRRSAAFLDLPIVVNQLEQRLQQYATTETITRHPDAWYNAFIVQPDETLIAAWDDSAQVADLLELRTVSPPVEAVTAGDTIAFDMGIRIHWTPPEMLHFFVHLAGEPTPFDGGELYATGDEPLCAEAYSPTRTTDETLVQPLTVTLPDDLPAGNYTIAVGMYDPATNRRLPLNTPDEDDRYYAALRFTVR